MICKKCNKECTPRPKEIMCLCMAKHYACIPCKTRYADWGDKVEAKPMSENELSIYTFRFDK